MSCVLSSHLNVLQPSTSSVQPVSVLIAIYLLMVCLEMERDRVHGDARLLRLFLPDEVAIPRYLVRQCALY